MMLAKNELPLFEKPAFTALNCIKLDYFIDRRI